MKSIKLLVLILVTGLSSISLHAQLLYEISGNNTHAKSYLLATNPLVNRTFLDTIPNVFTVFGKCNKVLTEFAMQDYEALSALRQAALLPDSIVLTRFYSEQDYQSINQAFLSAVGMGMEQLCRMKPAYLTELYRTTLLQKWLGYDEALSTETFFQQVAQQTSIPVYGLDDIGETLYMQFDREPFEYQCSELLSIVTYPDRELQQEQAISNMYRNGRLADIAFLIQSPDNHSTVSYSDYEVYAKRNVQWVKRLQPYLQEGKVFITLNANYLGGEKGLIAMLRKEGYRVKRVNR